MIIVTGGAGFIGSNIVKALNQAGRTDILVVDDLTDGHKFRNLVNYQIADYMDFEEFIASIKSEDEEFQYVEAVIHMGACSDTTEWDGHYMMQNNYSYSKHLFEFCIERKIPLVYASSAATYGAETVFKEDAANEKPLNVYGYSKLLFDNYVRERFDKIQSQVVGLRFFNVYGPGEAHKGSMASVAFHLNNQLKANGVVKLFEGTDGYGNGEQRRDFVYVADVANAAVWFLDHQDKSGIFNLGTGRSQTFNDVANAVLDWHKTGKLEYIPFPEHLQGSYQSFTEADISALREVGYDKPFVTVEEGVKDYLDQINS